MITGSVNSEHEALVRLTVLGPTGERADVEAPVDTGSDGYLTLPPDLIERLQLPWLQSGQAVLADGTETVFDIHGGSVRWGGESRRVLIDVIDSAPLIGTALLAGHEVTIQVTPGGEVAIRPLRLA
jgi:clan AA aspartic protease